MASHTKITMPPTQYLSVLGIIVGAGILLCSLFISIIPQDLTILIFTVFFILLSIALIRISTKATIDPSNFKVYMNLYINDKEINVKPKDESPTIAWYFLPFFLQAIGGVIMYFGIRKDDKIMAQYGLFLGIGMTTSMIIIGLIENNFWLSIFKILQYW